MLKEIYVGFVAGHCAAAIAAVLYSCYQLGGFLGRRQFTEAIAAFCVLVVAATLAALCWGFVERAVKRSD